MDSFIMVPVNYILLGSAPTDQAVFALVNL